VAECEQLPLEPLVSPAGVNGALGLTPDAPSLGGQSQRAVDSWGLSVAIRTINAAIASLIGGRPGVFG